MSGMVPYLGSTWSSKQFSVPENRSIVAFGNEDKGRQTVIGMRCPPRGPGAALIALVVGGTGKYYKYSYTPDKSECKQEAVEQFLKSSV